MALPQPTGPLHGIAPESFLIAGWQMDPASTSLTNSSVLRMKWEYKIYSWKQPSGVLFRGAGAIPGDEITVALNKLGNEGWEAVSVFPIAMAEGATNTVGILLKRAVPG